MTEFLVKVFIKDYDNTDNIKVRTSYGVLTSVVGVICNILLFFVKFLLGAVLNSIAVMADAFNNLSDAASSVIGFVGVKMASKPADKDHPFGHGRIEYIAALIVSFLIIEVGFTFLKDAVKKIFNPQLISFNTTAVVILLLSISVKLWLAAFNKKLGSRINSKVMHATAADAMGDVLTTSATIVSILICHFTSLNIDGIVGVLVALVVMWAGFSIAKDTLEPLIGEAVDPQIYQAITQMVESYEGIIGSHDLIVHNYGPGRSMASIHAEVPNNVAIEVSHEIIDKIERDIANGLGVFLVIHMDPVEVNDDRVITLKKTVEKIIAKIDERISVHDFRFVDGKEQINLIFDVVVPYEYTEDMQKNVKRNIKDTLKQIDKRYNCIITTEKSYVSSEEK